jgi:hypothetical protein
MADASEPKPIIPALAPFYDKSRDLAWLVVRCTAGGILLVHGLDKVLYRSIAGFASGSLARRGIEPSVPLAYAVFWRRSVRSASSSACSRVSSRPRSAFSFCSSSTPIGRRASAGTGRAADGNIRCSGD